VTIDSSDPTIEAPETIRVGFWVSSADSNPTDTLNLTYTELATDHIRPLVYMHDGGSNIDVYNVHTSAFVRTIPNVGAQLGDMEISSDGSYLYVADLTNYDIVPVNLDTDAVDSPIDLAGAGSLWLAYGRTQGKSLLFSSTGLILDPDTGSAFATTFLAGYNSGSMPAISQNGEKVCGVRLGVSPYTIECYDIDYSAKNGGALTLTSLGTARPGSNAKDLALTQDGSRVYVASGAPYNFVGIDTDTMVQDQTLPANAYPNCVEIGSNNLLYGGAFSWYGPLDLWVYSFTGIEQSSYYISGYADEIRDRQLVLSGDGLRIILSATDPKVVMLDSP
jgi:DNA-binding beta-propeller fold protein YncE